MIGGSYNAEAEEMNSNQLWARHAMSPVNGYDSWFSGFTALSIETSLFIFGRLRLLSQKIKLISGGFPGGVGYYWDVESRKVLEWNGFSWNAFENELCTRRVYHTTIIYGGEIYHMGRYTKAEINR